MQDCWVGIDIGGTNIKIGAVDADCRILKSIILSSVEYNTPDELLTAIADAVVEIMNGISGYTLKSIGVGIAALVDINTGVVIFSPNLGWKDVPVAKILKEKLSVPVYAVNDLTAITFGEWKYGAGRGYNDIVCLFVGTGIGGGIVSGGNFIWGADHRGGELGHTTIFVGGRQCSCGAKGCLEAYAGGWAIAKRTREEIHKQPKAGKEIIGIAGEIEKITAKHVVEAFKKGDPLAVWIIDDTIVFLSSGIASIVNMLNPAIIILGGGVIHSMPEIINMIGKQTKKRALDALTQGLIITGAELGDKSGMVGAAYIVREGVVNGLTGA